MRLTICVVTTFRPSLSRIPQRENGGNVAHVSGDATPGMLPLPQTNAQSLICTGFMCSEDLSVSMFLSSPNNHFLVLCRVWVALTHLPSGRCRQAWHRTTGAFYELNRLNQWT